jgi:hypothetical protein
MYDQTEQMYTQQTDQMYDQQIEYMSNIPETEPDNEEIYDSDDQEEQREYMSNMPETEPDDEEIYDSDDQEEQREYMSNMPETEPDDEEIYDSDDQEEQREYMSNMPETEPDDEEIYDSDDQEEQREYMSNMPETEPDDEEIYDSDDQEEQREYMSNMEHDDQEIDDSDDDQEEMTNTDNVRQTNKFPSGFDGYNSFANVAPTQNNVAQSAYCVAQKSTSYPILPNSTSRPNINTTYPSPINMKDAYASVNPVQPAIMHAPAPTRVVEKMANTPTIKMYNFNTSWCGWSTKFQPEWDKFMANVNSDNSLNGVVEVKDVKCDNDDNKQLAIDNNVQGYPTVVIINKGVSSHYTGPRTVEGLKEALRNMLK